MWPSTTSGCKTNSKVETATGKQNVYTLDFVDASTTYAEANCMMPSDYDAGTVTATFVWFSTNAGTLVARWQIEGYIYGDHTTLDETFGTAQAVDDAGQSTANDVLISGATAAMTFGGTPAASKLALFRVGRLGGHANDTLTVDARLLGVMIAYSRS